MEHDYEKTDKAKILDAYKEDLSVRDEVVKDQEDKFYPKETESSRERHNVLDEYQKIEKELNEMEYTSKNKLTELAAGMAKRQNGNNNVKDEDIDRLVQEALRISNGSFAEAAGKIKYYFTK